MAKARIADLDKALAESNANAAAMRAEKDAALKGLASLDPSRNPNPVPSGVPGGVPTMAASNSVTDAVPAWMPALMAHLDARIGAKLEAGLKASGSEVKKDVMLAAAFAAGSTRKTSEMLQLKEELFGAVQDSMRASGPAGAGSAGGGGSSAGAASLAKQGVKRSRDTDAEEQDYGAFAAALFKPQRVETPAPLFTQRNEFEEPMTVTFAAANGAAPPPGLDSLGSFPLAGDVLAPLNSFELLGPLDQVQTEMLYRLVPSARPGARAGGRR